MTSHTVAELLADYPHLDPDEYDAGYWLHIMEAALALVLNEHVTEADREQARTALRMSRMLRREWQVTVGASGS